MAVLYVTCWRRRETATRRRSSARGTRPAIEMMGQEAGLLGQYFEGVNVRIEVVGDIYDSNQFDFIELGVIVARV